MSLLDRATLDAALIAAHEAGDPAMLAALYRKAAKTLERLGQVDAALFFFTQAYVFALDAGLAEADDVGRILRANGRL